MSRSPSTPQLSTHPVRFRDVVFPNPRAEVWMSVSCRLELQTARTWFCIGLVLGGVCVAASFVVTLALVSGWLMR